MRKLITQFKSQKVQPDGSLIMGFRSLFIYDLGANLEPELIEEGITMIGENTLFEELAKLSKENKKQFLEYQKKTEAIWEYAKQNQIQRPEY